MYEGMKQHICLWYFFLNSSADILAYKLSENKVDIFGLPVLSDQQLKYYKLEIFGILNWWLIDYLKSCRLIFWLC